MVAWVFFRNMEGKEVAVDEDERGEVQERENDDSLHCHPSTLHRYMNVVAYDVCV